MGEVTVGSGAGRRVFEVRQEGVRAVALVAAGRRLAVADDGLRLVVDGRTVTAGDLTLVGVPQLAAGGDRLRWRLEGHGLAVDAAVEADPGGGVVRTRLQVSGQGRLERIEVERWRRSPLTARVSDVAVPPELGQPLWGDGVFAGLEHPGAENVRSEGGEATFGLPVDVSLDRQAWTGPPVVVGGAAPGQERTAFWDELDRLRASPARLVVLANNWYQLGFTGRMNEATVEAELEGFGAVAAGHGLALDHYCLDDPWDGEWAPETGIWGRLAPSRFPGGLARLQAAGEGRVGSLGLWVSPWGGYFDRHDHRVAWGRAHGYEVQDGSWPCLCPAGEQYREHLRDSLVRWTRAGVRYWKLDGVQFDCAAVDHGHPVGPAGRTAQMDSFGALLDEVRAVDPGVVLTFTSGSNPSPWWLRHADFLWRGGLDDDAPAELEGGRHERFATYIDSCLDALRASAVPVSAIVTFSVVENQERAYRDAGEDAGAWERHCWLLAGRGTHHHDLYVAPDSLTGTEWDALSRALRWARANQPVLARSRMIGGRPQAGEAYGFVSTGDGKAVLCLRNPSERPQPLTVAGPDLNGSVEDLEAVRGGPAPAPAIDAGQTVTVELGPFEVMLLSGRWRPGTRPGPPG